MPAEQRSRVGRPSLSKKKGNIVNGTGNEAAISHTEENGETVAERTEDYTCQPARMSCSMYVLPPGDAVMISASIRVSLIRPLHLWLGVRLRVSWQPSNSINTGYAENAAI